MNYRHHTLSNTAFRRIDSFPLRGVSRAGKLPLYLIFTPIFLFLATIQPLHSREKKEDEKVEDQKKENPYSGLGFPVISFDRDTGVSAGLFGVLTRNEKNYQPYHSQYYVGLQKSNLGLEIYQFAWDAVNIFHKLRWKGNTGYYRNLVNHYYGYGNYHDLVRQKRIAEGQIPIGTNTPESPDLLQLNDEVTINENYLKQNGQPLLNKSRRVLRESQNKYFMYDMAVPFYKTSLEGKIAGTHLKWQAGINIQSVKIFSYHGDRENNNSVANIETLIDVEKPIGYNATNGAKWSNGLSLAIGYDTRPESREKNPDSGIFTDLFCEVYGKALGSDYSFYRATFTWRQYISLAQWDSSQKEVVFAYRLLVHASNGEIPFFETGEILTMSETSSGLGGATGLRGYPSYQFVDRRMVMGNAELRMTLLHTKFNGGTEIVPVIFADAGRVAPAWKELSTEGIHTDAGISLRFVFQKTW